MHDSRYGGAGRLPQFSLHQSDNEFIRDSNGLHAEEEEDEQYYRRSETFNDESHLDFDRMTDGQYMLGNGGLGSFLASSVGRKLTNTLLFFGLCLAGVLLIIVNRIIIWGPYLQDNYTPQTRLMYMIALERSPFHTRFTTWAQMCVVLCLFTFFAGVVSWRRPLLESAGLVGTGVVLGGHTTSSQQCKESAESAKDVSSDLTWRSLLAVQREHLKLAYPLAVLTTGYIDLTAVSMHRVRLPAFVLTRIATVPLVLLLTLRFVDTRPLRATIMAVILSSLTLGLASAWRGIFVNGLDIVLGTMCSLLAALWPSQIPGTLRKLSESRLTADTGHIGQITNSRQEEAALISLRTFVGCWTLLYHTTLMATLALSIPMLLTGDLEAILHGPRLPFSTYWLMVLLGGIAGFIVLISTVALSLTTSPLAASYVFIPQASLVWPIMLGNQLPLHVWAVLSITWLSCLWFLQRRVVNG